MEESKYLIRVETSFGRVDVLFPETEWDSPIETTISAYNDVAEPAFRRFIRDSGVGVSGIRFSPDLCSPVDLVRTLEVNESYHHDSVISSWELVYGLVPGEEGDDDIFESAYRENHTLGCLYMPLPETEAQVFMNFTEALPVEDMLTDGDTGEPRIERNPHVTIRYGFPSNVGVEQIKAGMPHKINIYGTYGLLGVFKQADCDVLYVEVNSLDLRDIHREVSDNVPCAEMTFDKYRPHVTLAYLKPGTGDKYVGMFFFGGIPFKSSILIYSDSDGNNFPITIQDRME